MKAWLGTIAITLLVAGIALFGQSLSITPSTLLANCQPPASGALIHCNVANDPSNPTGDYVSANGAAYFLISQAQQSGTTAGSTIAWSTVAPNWGDTICDPNTGDSNGGKNVSCTAGQVQWQNQGPNDCRADVFFVDLLSAH